MKAISLILFLIFSQHFTGERSVLHTENKSVFAAAAISSAQSEISGPANFLENEDDETDSEIIRQSPVLLSSFASAAYQLTVLPSGKTNIRNSKSQRFLLYKIRVLRL